ncbi:SDR family oxidoreductase [Candidatus Acetothermia bacterium]|jgi:3-oxoacyl-[acyl-carrier protein] reductase|nr:SDR family oxidoreductase [Candidatus Acetothermia bacterium]MCI2427688.1 SDR family oxidoreductase [Candidatus Acetothermia bacterium]MCI2428314.1 SDR family oxidoreductase [Candidatus Acetothermia bacterium]
MDLGLAGKVAIIGGGSRGLGKACALRLAQEGVNVAIYARDRDAIEAAAKEIRAAHGVQVLPIAADQSNPAEIERLVTMTQKRFGRIDIAFNNTGGPPPGIFSDHDDEAWEEAFQGLLMSVVRICRAVIPIMRAQGGGRIINNTSFTVKEPADRLILSNVFRVGVIALAKTLSRELASDNILINNVCPGSFDTERMRHLLEQQAAATNRPFDVIKAAWVEKIPIGRLQRPEELADLVVFLASERASGITGTTIPVDGGMLHGLF